MPALTGAGGDLHSQIREEVSFTQGRIIVRGKLHSRGEQKRADYILYYKSNIPWAVIEARDNSHSVGAGMQQALNYAETLGLPFVFSSNGKGFLLHDRSGLAEKTEQELAMDAFPSAAQLWQRYCQWKGLESADARHTVEMPYYDDGASRAPRYYQANAINNTVEAMRRLQVEPRSRTMSLTRAAVTPSSQASALAERPSGIMQSSRNTSPGWSGRMAFLPMMCAPGQ